MSASAGIDWRTPGITLRELTLRQEQRQLEQWDAVVTLQERLEWLVSRQMLAKPRTWIELHPLRTRPPAEPASSGLSGFDALLELARI